MKPGAVVSKLMHFMTDGLLTQLTVSLFITKKMGRFQDEYKRGLTPLYSFILIGCFLTFIKSIFVDVLELLKLFNKYLLLTNTCQSDRDTKMNKKLFLSFRNLESDMQTDTLKYDFLTAVIKVWANT